MIELKADGEWLVGQLREQEAGCAIGQLLRERWKWPKKTVHLLFQNKEIKLDGQPAAQHTVVEAGQTLAVRVLMPEEPGISPVAKTLDILYEDDHLLVVNKPAGLLLHPTEKQHTDSLDHRVAGHFSRTGIKAKVRHIHRLDQETSGAVLYAKHALAGALLDEELRVRRIKRTYLAFAEGKLAKPSGTINKPIGRDRHHPVRRRVTPGGETAVTHYRLVVQYDTAAQIECQLDTGRTHQIRVHLSDLGHPIIGDTLYGGRGWTYPRQALHAASLRLIHPFGGADILAKAPLPDELLQLEKDLQQSRL